MNDIRDGFQTVLDLLSKQSDHLSKLDQNHVEPMCDVKTERLSNNAIREEGCPDEIDSFSVEAGFHDLQEKMESIRDAIAGQQNESDENDKSVLADIKAVFNELKVNQRKILDKERLPSIVAANIIDIKLNIFQKDSFIDLLG